MYAINTTIQKIIYYNKNTSRSRYVAFTFTNYYFMRSTHM